MNIITPEQVQQGDKIRVTRDTTTADRKGSVVNEGVVAEFTYSQWRTAEGWQLFTDREGAVIELLDRPKPKIVLPTGEHAVIQYHRGSTLWTGRFDGREWHLSGNERDWHVSYLPSTLTSMLNHEGPVVTYVPRTGYTVLFEGVAK